MGQLETERWFMGTLTWHNFLLGCTALCLTVCSTRHYAAGPAGSAIVDVVGSLELLQHAKAVFEKQSARSKDTRKVRRLIEATILEFSGQDNGDTFTMQASLHTGRALASEAHGLAIPSSQYRKDWLWNESTIMPVDDGAWAYMEQFLGLPDEDFMTDTWC